MVQTYQQVQEIRPYYVFPSVDVDRYTVDGVYRQVMLSGRELDTNRLPAQARNWVNETLQYTHGYGVAMSPVTQVTPEGLPEFMVKDIPPVTDAAELQITRPEIYYGERTYGNVVVKTSAEEFDYPKRDGNAFTTYEGNGGVPMGNFINRLAYTIRMMDPNLFLSSYILPREQNHVPSADRPTRPRNRALPLLRLRPLSRHLRRPSVLDPGCVHNHQHVSLFQTHGPVADQLHPQCRQSRYGPPITALSPFIRPKMNP